jgi:hypothetical protein
MRSVWGILFALMLALLPASQSSSFLSGSVDFAARVKPVANCTNGTNGDSTALCRVCQCCMERSGVPNPAPVTSVPAVRSAGSFDSLLESSSVLEIRMLSKPHVILSGGETSIRPSNSVPLFEWYCSYLI